MLTKTSFTIRLHANDDVVIARQQLVSGTALLDEHVKISGLIPPGHKVATRAIAVGEPIKRYNQIIGFAKRPIAPGEHVHLHNMAMGEFDVFLAEKKRKRLLCGMGAHQLLLRLNSGYGPSCLALTFLDAPGSISLSCSASVTSFLNSS